MKVHRPQSRPITTARGSGASGRSASWRKPRQPVSSSRARTRNIAAIQPPSMCGAGPGTPRKASIATGMAAKAMLRSGIEAEERDRPAVGATEDGGRDQPGDRGSEGGDQLLHDGGEGPHRPAGVPSDRARRTAARRWRRPAPGRRPPLASRRERSRGARGRAPAGHHALGAPGLKTFPHWPDAPRALDEFSTLRRHRDSDRGRVARPDTSSPSDGAGARLGAMPGLSDKGLPCETIVSFARCQHGRPPWRAESPPLTSCLTSRRGLSSLRRSRPLSARRRSSPRR